MIRLEEISLRVNIIFNQKLAFRVRVPGGFDATIPKS